MAKRLFNMMNNYRTYVNRVPKGTFFTGSVRKLPKNVLMNTDDYSYLNSIYGACPIIYKHYVILVAVCRFILLCWQARPNASPKEFILAG